MRVPTKCGLDGLNVLEVGEGVSAAMAGKMLAGLGAQVVKIEAPSGDPLRHQGPFRDDKINPEASGSFLLLNTTKRSVQADLSTSQGQARLCTLLSRADILITDFSPAKQAALGLAQTTLQAQYPALVALSITPFGLRGPYSHYKAEDITLIHGSGWGWVTPGKGCPIERPPIRPFGRHAQTQAGIHGACLALAASIGAKRSGVGEAIDFSALQGVSFLLGRHFSTYVYTLKADHRSDPALYEPMNIYPCKDGYIFIICPEQNQFERLLDLMGQPEWARDDAFHVRSKRLSVSPQVKQHLAQWTKQHKAEELFHLLQKEKVGGGVVFTPQQISQQPHLHERGFFMEQYHFVAGKLLQLGPHSSLEQPWHRLSPAPLLGEANNVSAQALFNHTPLPDQAQSTIAGSPRHRFLGEDNPNGLVRSKNASSTALQKNPLPLEGLRVLDLSWVWAGPHCTLMLAHLGAEVIKVESSGRLDLTRRADIFPHDMEPGKNRNGYFNLVNQSKKSIGIDLTKEAGRDLVRQLASKCDVVISNFGYGVLHKLGLDPPRMKQMNPRIIQVIISAFGQSGPYKAYTGYGPLFGPLGGISAQTGYEEDGLPQDLAVAYGDPNGGVYAAFDLLSALWAGRVHGQWGQVIDVSMWEAILHTNVDSWARFMMGHDAATPSGNRDPYGAPCNLYSCLGEDAQNTDAWVSVAALDDTSWQGLCKTLSQPQWAGDSRFATAKLRKRYEAEIDAAIEAFCASRTRWQITEIFQANGVAALPSLSAEDLVKNPHLQARQAFNQHDHPEVGPRSMQNAPWLLSNCPNGLGQAAPLLGQHTEQVLQSVLRFDSSKITALKAKGVIESASPQASTTP